MYVCVSYILYVCICIQMYTNVCITLLHIYKWWGVKPCGLLNVCMYFCMWHQSVLFPLSRVTQAVSSPADTHATTANVNTDDPLEGPSHGSQTSSAEPCRPAASRKRARQDSSDKLLSAISERIQSIPREDDCDVFGKTIACKLRIMRGDQRVIAERLINEVLFHGQVTALTVNSTIAIRPHNTQTHTMADVHTESTSTTSSDVQFDFGKYDLVEL